MRNFLKDIENVVITLLTLLTVTAASHTGMRFVLWVAGGVSICALLDFLTNRLIFKRVVVPKSAIISGFIVSGILDWYQPWYILFIFSALPVISKHLVRFKGRHIFNPANFALFIASLSRVSLTWSIQSNAYIIIAVGIYIAYKLKRLPHIIGFLLTFIVLFAAGGINPLMLVSWFFVFVMLIEPKTSGPGRAGGFVFGAICC